jgi:hypothetical protein
MFRFTPWMIYVQRNSPQSQSGCYGEEKNPFLLLEIELRFLGCPVTISIELPQLPSSF